MSRSWAAVRDNVTYLGCYADYAYDHPEYQSEKNYNTKSNGSTHIRDPKLTEDRVLPEDNKYDQYLDGPSRRMSAMGKYEPGSAQDPHNLELHQAALACYNVAIRNGKRYFALQNGGECMTTNSEVALKNRLPDSKCEKECTATCTKNGKPCGKKCIAKGGDCKNRHMHQACGAKETDKGHKGGGFFTNSVYEIKNMQFQEGSPEAAVQEHQDVFKEFRYQSPVPGGEMECPDYENGFFPLSPTQTFSAMYVRPSMTAKAVIHDRSAGTGKTCEAVAIMDNFFDKKWRVIWVTRGSLRHIPGKELFGKICSQTLRGLVEKDDSIRYADGRAYPDTDTKEGRIRFIRTHGQQFLKRAKRYNIELTGSQIISYDEFVQTILGSSSEGRAKRASWKRGSDDMGRKTLFVIDEAHNLGSSSLPEEERAHLGKKHDSFVVEGKTYHSKQDVYGKAAYPRKEALHGRDAIAAMLYHSYKKSGKDSAKAIFLTATPMTTTPLELLWLLNLAVPDEKDRLPMNLSHYYNKDDYTITEKATQQFARAAHGRMLYFNSSQNPTNFIIKRFSERVTTPMHEFHYRAIQEKVSILDAAYAAGGMGHDAYASRMVQIYQNLALTPMMRGTSYSEDQLREYEDASDRGGVSRAELMGEAYDREIEMARKIFRFNRSAKDRERYQLLLSAYTDWVDSQREDASEGSEKKAKKRGIRKPPFPPTLAPYVDEYGHLKTMKELKGEAGEIDGVIPETTRSEYERRIEGLETYERENTAYLLNPGRKRAPKKPSMDGIIVDFPNQRATLAEYHRYKISNKVVIPASSYQELKHKYIVFRKKLREWDLNRTNGDYGNLPILKCEVEDVLDENGLLISEDDFFRRHMVNKFMRSKKRYSKTETPYLKYLMRDPGTGFVRLKTREEFLVGVTDGATLDPVPSGDQASFVFWHRKFNAKYLHRAMPYYMPKIDSMLKNIIDLEASSVSVYGHGFKHGVFTFSTATKSTDYEYYGSRAVAAAFHAHPKFRLLTIYDDKMENVNGNRVRKVSVRPGPGDDDKIGVVVMSSRYLKNVFRGGRDKIEYTNAIKDATERFVNSVNNTYGDQAQVLVLDGAFMEGVSAYDFREVHFLDPGMSRENLEQASARFARVCGSTNIPFAKNMGAFLNMHFYDLVTPNGSLLYDEMMRKLPDSTVANMNLIGKFTKLSSRYAVDHWLTKRIHEFESVHDGVVEELYYEWDRAYVVSIVTQNLDAGESIKVRERMVIPPDHVIGVSMVTGTRVLVPGQIDQDSKLPDSAAEGVIVSVDRSEGTVRVTMDTGAVLETPMSELRVPFGTKIKFRMPYGVDVAQRVMNIGNVRMSKKDEKVHLDRMPLKLPEDALNVVHTAFQTTPHHTLLGVMGLLDTLTASGGIGVPIRFVLPGGASLDRTPSYRNFSVMWECTGNEHNLHSESWMWDNFFSATTGVSVMFLVLSGRRCDGDYGNDNDVYTNLLIYVPQWKTVERFDPNGYEPYLFNSVELDTRLQNLISDRDPELHYMSAAETSPLASLGRLSGEDGLNTRKLGAAFALFYLFMRLKYAGSVLHEHPHTERHVYPLAFQKALINRLQSDRSETGDLTSYVMRFAAGVSRAQTDLERWRGYKRNRTFWGNAVKYIEHMQSEASRYGPVRKRVSRKGVPEPVEVGLWDRLISSWY